MDRSSRRLRLAFLEMRAALRRDTGPFVTVSIARADVEMLVRAIAAYAKKGMPIEQALLLKEKKASTHLSKLIAAHVIKQGSARLTWDKVAARIDWAGTGDTLKAEYSRRKADILIEIVRQAMQGLRDRS